MKINMKTIPTANESFTALLNLYSAFRPLNVVENYTKKYGDFYRLRVSNNNSFIVLSNPQAVKEIFTASPNIFESAKANKVLNFLLGDNAILLLDGQVHRNRRRLLMPPFHGESLQKNTDRIVEITNEVFSRIQINTPFKVRDCMQEITLRVILNVVFGLDSGAKSKRLRKLLVELLETFNTPWKSLLIIFPVLQKDLGIYSPWGHFLRLKAEIRQIIYQEIKDRRSLLETG
jgi:cytochrome P450 family 110